MNNVQTKRKRILIIEDESTFRSFLEHLVGSRYQTLSAGSWSEAKGLLYENTIDVVLVDLRLPEKSGREIVQTIRREFDHRIRIIVITGHENEWNTSQAIMSGVHAFLKKGSFRPEDLFTAIERCTSEENVDIPLPGKQLTLTRLADFTNRLVSMNNLNEVLLEVIKTIREVTGCVNTSVMLLSENGRHLFVKKAVGPDGDRVESSIIDITDNIAGKTYDEVKPLSPEDLNSFCNQYFQYREQGPFMSIPLFEVPFSSGNKPIGVIKITHQEREKQITRQEKSLLIHIANAASIAVENAQRKKALEKASIDTLILLTNVLEVRDRYTQGHSVRVSRFAREIASRVGFSEQELEDIRYGAQLHDIGKIQIPDAVLLKEGTLTEGEYEMMKLHPVTSMKLVDHIEFFGSIKPLFLHHHERYDGRGYPDGIGGEDIEMGARIIAVADAYDAMTSDRPYRRALSRDTAISTLVSERGRQFDPECVDAMVDYLDSPWFSDDIISGFRPLPD